MNFTADAEVVVITGTRKGIGRSLAEHFLKRGTKVIGCSREPTDLRAGGYEHHCVDVSNEQQVRKLFATVWKKHGRLDILINNAGIAAMNHALLTPGATVDRIFATNFLGTFLCCREAARLMQRKRHGRIINIGTVAVPMRLEGELVYAASKSAVITLTQILARELAPFNITVNAVGVTPVETDLIRSVPKEKIDRIIEGLAIKRLGRPEDVANVIDFFVRRESDYVTGQTVYLGGM